MDHQIEFKKATFPDRKRPISQINLILVSIIIALLIFTVLALGFYFFTRLVLFKDQPSKLTNQSPVPSAQTILGVDQSVLENLTPTDWVAKIGKLIVLPSGENPQIFILGQSDIDRFKSDSVLGQGEIGDVLLFYEKARHLILFSRKFDRVIGTKNLPVQQPPVSTIQRPKPNPTEEASNEANLGGP